MARRYAYAAHIQDSNPPVNKIAQTFAGRRPNTQNAPKDAFKNLYKDCEQERSLDGGLYIHSFASSYPATEDISPHGNGRFEHTDGCLSYSCTGTRNLNMKQGENRGCQYSAQYKIGNFCRTEIGNGGGNPTANPGPVGGGDYNCTAGTRADWASSTTTNGRSANEGVFTTGKYTLNAEKGVGIGVNKARQKNLWTRWEPDGTFHLQVKPTGDEGGIATIKIDPSGHITITSKTTLSIEAAESMSIDTPRLNIKADVSLKGELNQDGKHTDSHGQHTRCWC